MLPWSDALGFSHGEARAPTRSNSDAVDPTLTLQYTFVGHALGIYTSSDSVKTSLLALVDRLSSQRLSESFPMDVVGDFHLAPEGTRSKKDCPSCLSVPSQNRWG